MPTAEQFALYIQQAKPYLVELEREVQLLQYGEMDIKISIRAGVVEKMQLIKAKTWLRKDNV